MEVDITMLGGFSIRLDGAEINPAEWRRKQAAAIVKVLALTPRRTLHRELLIDQLWPELTVEDAAPRLHKAAHYARRALGGPRSLVLASESVALLPQDQVRVDALEFERIAEAARAADDAALAGRAADAYTGDLLPDDPYDEWAQHNRERLRVLYLDTLRLANRWDVLTTVDPTDEQAHLKVITALARRGDRRAALRQFERLERALRQELGVAPSRTAVGIRAALLAADTPNPAPSSGTAANASTPGAGRPTRPAQEPTTTRRADPPAPGAIERDLLNQVFEDVSSGFGRALFISGPPGVGKTTLLAWLEDAANNRGMRVASGIAAQVEGAWPYAPVLEAIADLSRRHPALLDGLDDALRTEIENALTGRAADGTAHGGQQRLFVAVAEMVRLAAAGAGTVIVIDDAHQADDASLRLLHYLARSTVSDRVLFVLAHRHDRSGTLTDVRRSLSGRGTAVRLEMKPLSYEAVSDLVRRFNPDVDDDFVGAVWVASAGIPFAIVELMRAGGDLHTVPARSLVLAALSTAQVRALEAVAILGLAFDTDEFLAVTGLPDDDAYQVLDQAQAHQLLVRTDAGFEFRHSLLRDALLDRLSPSQRRGLHRRAAQALNRLNRSPAQIGYHFVQGGEQAAAVPWVLQAARTSAALGAYREALDTLAAVRDQATGLELELLLSMRADFLMAAADAGAVDAYRDAIAATRDPGAQSRLRARLARAATVTGDLDTAAIALEGLSTDGTPDDACCCWPKGCSRCTRGICREPRTLPPKHASESRSAGPRIGRCSTWWRCREWWHTRKANGSSA